MIFKEGDGGSVKSVLLVLRGWDCQRRSKIRPQGGAKTGHFGSGCNARHEARVAPCVGAVPHGHWRNNTFIARLRNDFIDALMLIEGAMDGEAFCAWVEQMLAPTLAAGDIVICGNLSVRKNAKARAAIKARGAELRFLPAYSPDLNPVEKVFARIKALVRSADARSADTLGTAIASALTACTPQECACHLPHAGYAQLDRK